MRKLFFIISFLVLISYLPQTVTAQVDGQTKGGIELGQAPTSPTNIDPVAISEVHAIQITDTSAQIRWKTNKAGDSRVFYGISSGNYPYLSGIVAYETLCSSSTITTAHCVNLAGLKSSTIYYYKVATRRGFEEVTSGEFTFVTNSVKGGVTTTTDTTSPSPITDLSVSNLTSNSLVLTWTATGDDGINGIASSYSIRYSTSPITSDIGWQSATIITTGVPTPQSYGIKESMVVNNLSPNTTYYFVIKAFDEALNSSNLSNSPSGTTLAIIKTDNIPPIISNVRAVNIINTKAEIIWTTNELSDSLVFFGTSPNNYPNSSNWRCDAGGNVIDHCVKLFDLNYLTIYYYAVVSKDSSVNIATSTELRFVSASATTTIPASTEPSLITTTSAINTQPLPILIPPTIGTSSIVVSPHTLSTSTPLTIETSSIAVFPDALIQNLRLGSQGDNVRLLQQMLIGEGVYPEALVTGYFGPLTQAAVIKFQEKYTNEILVPLGLFEGTGLVGSLTRSKINQLYKIKKTPIVIETSLFISSPEAVFISTSTISEKIRNLQKQAEELTKILNSLIKSLQAE